MGYFRRVPALAIFEFDLVWMAIRLSACLILLWPTANSMAAAAIDVCSSPRIEFAPFEPKQLTWWTGKKQTSALREDGKPIAKIVLRYRNREPITVSMHEKIHVVKVGTHEFTYRINHIQALVWNSTHPAAGFIIPTTMLGKTSTQIITKANSYQRVEVEIDYGSVRGDERAFKDIHCFLTSRSVLADLK